MKKRDVHHKRKRPNPPNGPRMSREVIDARIVTTKPGSFWVLLPLYSSPAPAPIVDVAFEVGAISTG